MLFKSHLITIKLPCFMVKYGKITIRQPFSQYGIHGDRLMTIVFRECNLGRFSRNCQGLWRKRIVFASVEFFVLKSWLKYHFFIFFPYFSTVFMVKAWLRHHFWPFPHPADESSGPLWSPPRGRACLAERLGRAAGNVPWALGSPWSS